MNEIIRHLEYLLVTNDCVVMPGLGAVIAHTMPAKTDLSGLLIDAPARVFSFNAMLTHNDGLITTSVARARSISFEAARNIVANEVGQMCRDLASSGVVSLGAVGTLRKADGILLFVPGRQNSLSPMTMWLPQLSLRSLVDIAREREQRSQELARRSRGRFRLYVANISRIAASFALLLALGFVLSTPIEIENAQYASLGIENFTPADVHSEKTAVPVLRRPGELSSDLVLVVNRYDDACETADTAAHNAYVRERRATPVANQSSDLRIDDADPYCLIVASLVSENEARKYIEQSQNAGLRILAKDGRYRVYAATGENLQQAQTIANGLSKRYPGVWVCRK